MVDEKPSEKCTSVCKWHDDDCILAIDHEWDHVGLKTVWEQTELELQISTSNRLKQKKCIMNREPPPVKTRKRSPQPGDDDRY